MRGWYRKQWFYFEPVVIFLNKIKCWVKVKSETSFSSAAETGLDADENPNSAKVGTHEGKTKVLYEYSQGLMLCISQDQANRSLHEIVAWVSSDGLL